MATMDRARRSFLWINLLGGIAVLGSYALGLLTHPQTSDDIWGGIPAWMKPLYTLSMLSAAAGYFLFTFFIFFRVDPHAARIGGRDGFGIFNFLYVLILLPSALWMPLTFEMLAAPDGLLWAAIRMVLAVVGIASLGLIAALAMLDSGRSGLAYWLAIAGSIAFSVQTAFLDAVIWPAYFPY
jgi:hypothetical protein